MRILFAERRECGKALELSRQIDRKYADAAALQTSRFKEDTPRRPLARPGDPVAAYCAHLENIRKHLAIEDYSRVDAMGRPADALQRPQSGGRGQRRPGFLRPTIRRARESRGGPELAALQ